MLFEPRNLIHGKEADSDFLRPRGESVSRQTQTGSDNEQRRRLETVQTPSNEASRSEQLTDHPSASNTPLADRLEAVRALAGAQGFDSLDDVMLQYLTAGTLESPHLAEAQRKARRRFLPDLLQLLARDSSSWSNWEAQGYEQAVLRAAETVLDREVARAPGDAFRLESLRHATPSLQTLALDPQLSNTCDMLRNSVSGLLSTLLQRH